MNVLFRKTLTDNSQIRIVYVLLDGVGDLPHPDIENKTPFKRCFKDIEETFRTKKTGNRVLGMACTFCPYKLPCWGSKLQLLPQQQSQGKNPKWVWYTEVNNPKKEETFE